MREEISLDRAVDLVKSGKASSEISVRTVIHCGYYRFRVIGHNHDVCATSLCDPTMTVMGEMIAGEHCFNSAALYSACRRGWIDSELREWLNGEVFDSLPQAVRDAIRPVRRKTHGSNGYAYETVDLLFVPTESEMFGSAIYSARMDDERYEAFETADDRVVLDSNGNRMWYWLASPRRDSPNLFCSCSTFGYASADTASHALGVPLCFIIA